MIVTSSLTLDRLPALVPVEWQRRCWASLTTLNGFGFVIFGFLDFGILGFWIFGFVDFGLSDFWDLLEPRVDFGFFHFRFFGF